MNTIYALNPQALLASSTEVKETIDQKSVLLSLLIGIVAGGVMGVTSSIEDTSSSLYLGLLTLAILLFAIAVYRLLFKRKQLVYHPTGSPITCGSFYFDKEQIHALQEQLIAESITDIEKIIFKKSGNARLDFMVSSDGNFTAVQIYEYIPYKFEMVSDIICYSDQKSHPLAAFLLDKNASF